MSASEVCQKRSSADDIKLSKLDDKSTSIGSKVSDPMNEAQIDDRDRGKETSQSGNVRALAQRFEEQQAQRAKIVHSATLPTPRKQRCSTPSAGHGNSPVKRRVSSKVSANKPSVPLYKNRPGVSRRKSGALKKATSAYDIRNKSSPVNAEITKSRSAQERLANGLVDPEMDIKPPRELTEIPRESTPISETTTMDIFDLSALKSKRQKPKTLPKPAFLVLNRDKKTVCRSPEYAEYDTSFASSTPIRRNSQVESEINGEPTPTSEMLLIGTDLEISGHLYGCCLNSSFGGTCSTCSCAGKSANDSKFSEEIFSKVFDGASLVTDEMPALEPAPSKPEFECSPDEMRAISGISDECILNNDGLKREASPDSQLYAKMAEDIFEEEERRMRKRGEVGSLSSTSWETGSSISSQSAGDKPPKLIGFKTRSLSGQQRDFLYAESATVNYQAKKMSQSLYSETVLTSTDSSEAEEKVAKRKISKSLAKKLRPLSQPAIDMDKLLRIKSDIRLNLAKQVGKIKLRVTSATVEEDDSTGNKEQKLATRKKRAKSTFYLTKNNEKLDPNAHFSSTSESPEPGEVKGTIEFELDMKGSDAVDDGSGSDHAFDDDWSDTEDDQSESSEVDGGRNESERINSSGASPQLPDVIPDGSQRVSSPIIASFSEELPLPESSIYRVINDINNDEQNLYQQMEDLEENDDDNITPVATLERDAVSPMRLDSEGNLEYSSGNKSKLFLDGLEQSDSFGIDMIRSPSIDENGSIIENLQPTYSSRFIENQPLYQHYQKESDLQALRVVRNESMSSTEEAETASLGRPSTLSLSVSGSGRWCERRERLVASSNFGSQRSLWCELPEVKRAGLLDALGNQEKKLQEAMFEVITSEASYLRSLNILITHFMAAAQLLGKQHLGSVICAQDRKNLFSNILKVRDCSESLMSALEENFEEADMKLEDICGVLSEHFKRDFDVYVKYCSNQVYQDRTLKGLKMTNEQFLQVLQKLESNSVCEALDMRSFLMLPMQRITRYPLLIDAIYTRTQEGTGRHENAATALALANQIVRRCNEGARKMERMEQLLDIDRRLIYRNGDGLRKIPLVSSGRYLLKKEELIQLRRNADRYPTIRKGSLSAIANATPGRKKLKRQHLFLFTDLLIVAKKQKTSENFIVRDYCARQFVEVTPLEWTSSQVPQAALAALGTFRPPHLFLITLMQNAKGKQTDLVLCADSETDRARWVEALSPPPQPANPDEAIYADWDCPQVQAIHQYLPTQEDELRLEVGDVVNLMRKMQDGWMEGERQRDGTRGWFPRTYVVEILSDHVRARNYRQRLRLIQAAESLQRGQSAKVLKGFASPMGNEPAMTRSLSGPQGRRSSTSLKDQLRRLSNPKMLFQV